MTSSYKHYISEINIEGSCIKDMAMSKHASYVLMGAEKDKHVSIDPNHPDERGLIHFYQKETNRNINGRRVKEWCFMTPEEYQAQKANLPDICFATRHPINWLI